ncbi:DUF1045 domain-containing protein [Acidimangrovimonas sediminis]|uniref:DUF1045 domain-containing protein n=1 Tax=Acidimangrovimonas sediminis TaxID=2056283 RepID=UPI000C8034E7|nr:DUF1045 domain-containing protein [Acidimangrovimonas sediminis]
MPEFSRFAVYAAPPPGPLADFAARWLGWDPAAGRARPHPEVPGLPRTVADLTARPRRYGFHGTLKPPFRLAAGSTRAALEADLAALAARRAPVDLPGLRIARLGGFVALVPEGPAPALSALAAETVRALDHHRAPAPEAELARRRARGLSPAGEANLQRWGYPHVMEDFRFHLTLTGALPEAEAEAVRTALAPVLAPLLPRPFPVAELCLFGETAEGFHLLRRCPLGGLTPATGV